MRGCLMIATAVWLVLLAPTIFIPILHIFTFPVFVLAGIFFLLSLFWRRSPNR
jgi:hypothetical protein